MGRTNAVDAEDVLQQHRREVGKFVRHQRIHRGLTQRELGHLLGVGATAVSNFELGRCSFAPDLFLQIASILEMDRKAFGLVWLRWTNPWAYSLIYGPETIPDLPLIPRRLYRVGRGSRPKELAAEAPV